MKADVIMPVNSRRKNLGNKKSKCGTALAKADQRPKSPPPFRFGKLTYNEDKFLSRDVKSTRTEDRNRALTILGTKSNLRISATLRTFNGSITQGNGHCKKNSKEVWPNSQHPDIIASTCNDHVDKNRYDINEDVMPRKISDIKSDVRLGDSSSKDRVGHNEAYDPLSSLVPAALPVIPTAANGVGSIKQCIVAREFIRESKGRVERGLSKPLYPDREKGSKIGAGPKSKTSNDGHIQSVLVEECKQRINGKDKRSVSLVKQKSKRIPTRHIKYVSELDEQLRNKYRNRKNVVDNGENKPFQIWDRSGRSGIGAINRRFDEDRLIKLAEDSNGKALCGFGKLKDRPLIQRVKDSKSEEAESTKLTKNGHVKSAPPGRPAGKSVESFLVRNGLIPKAGSRSGKANQEGNLVRKKSVKLRLSRSRAKSLRKKNVVHCASKFTGKETVAGKVSNGFSHEDDRLSNYWKVGYCS